MAVVYILTNGNAGTDVLTTFAFKTGIESGSTGEGAAVTLFMLPVLAVVAIGMLFFAKRAEVYSIAEPGYTEALEFEDGKIMLGKHQSLKQMNWANIKERFGLEKFASHFAGAHLVGFVNWTMLTAMSDIWSCVLKEICPRLAGPR